MILDESLWEQGGEGLGHSTCSLTFVLLAEFSPTN